MLLKATLEFVLCIPLYLAGGMEEEEGGGGEVDQKNQIKVVIISTPRITIKILQFRPAMTQSTVNSLHHLPYFSLYIISVQNRDNPCFKDSTCKIMF